MWDEGDWPALWRLIVLIDTGSSLEHLKEIRMQEDRFGLSPKGRMSLHWRLPSDEPAPAPAAKKSKSRERYGHLHVVEDALAGS
jgi:hypothetical protein